MSLDRLWADWRAEYVANAGKEVDAGGCVICNLVHATDDAEALVLERTDATITVMNLFPYGSGHLMVAPVRHVGSLGDLDASEAAELHALTVQGIATLTEVYGPEGFNVGWNLGTVAGGSIAAHLHQHIVPRWSGDTNFMPVLADIKVLPEHLESTRARVTEAWT